MGTPDRPDRTELLSRYDRDLRAGWIMPEAEREEVRIRDGRVALVRWRRPEVGTSTVLYSHLQGLERGAQEDVIDRNLAEDRERGLTSYWKLHAHDLPVELGDLLAARGYLSDNDPGDNGPVMLRSLSPDVLPTRDAPGAELRRVGAGSLEHVVRVEQEIYGGDFGWLGARLAAHFELPDFLSVWVAYVGGEPACAGWTYLHPEGCFAVLRGGGTVPEHRRKGLYAAILLARLGEAARRGFRYAVVEPSPMNVPVVRSFGFETLTHAVDLVRRP